MGGGRGEECRGCVFHAPPKDALNRSLPQSVSRGMGPRRRTVSRKVCSTVHGKVSSASRHGGCNKAAKGRNRSSTRLRCRRRWRCAKLLTDAKSRAQDRNPAGDTSEQKLASRFCLWSPAAHLARLITSTTVQEHINRSTIRKRR